MHIEYILAPTASCADNPGSKFAKYEGNKRFTKLSLTIILNCPQIQEKWLPVSTYHMQAILGKKKPINLESNLHQFINRKNDCKTTNKAFKLFLSPLPFTKQLPCGSIDKIRAWMFVKQIVCEMVSLIWTFDWAVIPKFTSY